MVFWNDLLRARSVEGAACRDQRPSPTMQGDNVVSLLLIRVDDLGVTSLLWDGSVIPKGG